MATQRYDAAIIGGGHNGLICAAYLAKAGRRVVLLEAADRLGGLAREREIAPGLQAPLGAHLLTGFSPKVASDLELARHGLKLTSRSLDTVSLLPDAERLTLSAEPAVTDASLRRFSAADATRFPVMRARMLRLAAALRPFLLRTPPQLRFESWSDRIEMLRLALAIRRLGRADMRELLRIIGINVADLVEDAFESSALQGAIAFDAVLGNLMGPRSPNTVYTLLYRWAGAVEGQAGAVTLPLGGMTALIEALAGAARAAGAEIRSNAPVARILARAGAVEGVVLANGEVIPCPTVLSSAHPKSTLLDLLGVEHLDADFVRDIRHVRGNGANAKVNLVLSALPDALQDGTVGQARMIVAPSVQCLERSFDQAKYGAVPDNFALEAIVPTLHGTSGAASGRQLLSVIVQYAPHRLRGTDWATQRDALGDRVVAMLEEALPGLTDRIEARQVVTPADLESDFALPGGHWHHIETGLDQTFMLRPVPRFAQYRMPVAGLYLCGAGCHPGGGLTGAPGANAARQALADFKTERHRQTREAAE